MISHHERTPVTAFAEHLAATAAARASAGLARHAIPHDERVGTVDLAGNDYLGLRHDERVISCAIAALEDFGSGAGASRLVTGTHPVHEDLEESLAEHLQMESALVFSTGYHANLSVLSALADEDTLIVSDAHNHASIIDGCRLARGPVTVVPHNDTGAVEHALATRTQRRAVVVVESVFSVRGDAAPLAELSGIARRHDALLIVDEAHGVGVIGDRGEGLVASLGLAGSSHIVVTTSLSKSLASQGGAVLGPHQIREHLVNTARPFIYDTGLAPASAGAALGALDRLTEEPELAKRVRTAAAALAEACGVSAPAGAVLAIPMPDPHAALVAVDVCAAHGIRIGCFRPPSTPDGSTCLRITAHANLHAVDLEQAGEVLRAVTSGV